MGDPPSGAPRELVAGTDESSVNASTTLSSESNSAERVGSTFPTDDIGLEHVLLQRGHLGTAAVSWHKDGELEHVRTEAVGTDITSSPWCPTSILSRVSLM
jgi:hypothetical protein